MVRLIDRLVLCLALILTACIISGCFLSKGQVRHEYYPPVADGGPEDAEYPSPLDSPSAIQKDSLENTSGLSGQVKGSDAYGESERGPVDRHETTGTGPDDSTGQKTEIPPTQGRLIDKETPSLQNFPTSLDIPRIRDLPSPDKPGMETGPDMINQPQPAPRTPIKKPDSSSPKLPEMGPEETKIEKKLGPGSHVLVVEEHECSNFDGHWILAYEGRIVNNDANEATVQLSKRYGYRFWPDETGIDDTEWWCIPRRRHCYKEEKFENWGGQFKPDQIRPFPMKNIYDLDQGLIAGFETIVSGECEK